jgi:hypothetical protein
VECRQGLRHRQIEREGRLAAPFESLGNQRPFAAGVVAVQRVLGR